MIADEPNDAPASVTPGSNPGVFLSLRERVAASVANAIERERLTYRAEDLVNAMTSAGSSLASAVDSIQANARRAADQADTSVKLLVGRYRGHASRVAQEAIDSLAKFANKSRDAMNYRLSEARNLLWTTPGRSATRSEIPTLSVLSPVDAAAYVIMDKAEAQNLVNAPAPSVTTDTTAAPGGDATPAQSGATYQSVIDLANSLRGQTPVTNLSDGLTTGLSPAPGGSGTPIDPPIGCEIGDQANDHAYLVPGLHWFDSTIILMPPDLLHPVLSLAKLNGATVIFGTLRQPGATSNLWSSEVTAHFPDGSSFTYSVGYGKLNNWETNDAPYHVFANYPNGYLPVSVGNPTLVTCHPGVPLPPPASPPPPIIEEPDQPTTVPNPACCPPDPLERAEGVANEQFPEFVSTQLPSRDWCDYMEFILGKLTSADGSGGDSPAPPDQPKKTGWWASVANSTISGSIYNLAKEWAFAKDPVAGSQSEALVQSQVYNQELLKKYVAQLSTDIEGGQGKIVPLMASLSLFSWSEKFTGAPVMYMAKPYVQALNYLLPRDLPGQADVDALYLTGAATDSDWECMTRSLGNIPAIHRRVRDTKHTVPNVAENVDLWMRKKIDFPDLEHRLRYQGVQSDQAIREWIALREQIPQFQDIIRFMVRDTENAGVVAQGQLDLEFGDNFNGQLADWAEQQGITPELAIRFWRAHWDLPSPTMAYEMLRRLRPGRVDPSLVVDHAQVRKLLGTADYAPGWRDKMIAVSYLTPTRTDIKQGYARDVYSRETVLEMLQDTGLDANGAEQVAKLYDWEKQQFKRTRTEKSSALSVKAILGYYSDATINEREASDLLKEFGFDQDQLKTLLASADLRATAETRKNCIAAIRRRYFVGAIDEPTAIKLLMARDIDLGQAEDLAERWNCQITASVQEVPARKNLDWAIRGVISLAEFETRLRRLRYDDADVSRFLAEAEQRISEAVANAIAKQAREALAQGRRNLADVKKQIAELEKKKKELEKATKPKGGK